MRSALTPLTVATAPCLAADEMVLRSEADRLMTLRSRKVREARRRSGRESDFDVCDASIAAAASAPKLRASTVSSERPNGSSLAGVPLLRCSASLTRLIAHHKSISRPARKPSNPAFSASFFPPSFCADARARRSAKRCSSVAQTSDSKSCCCGVGEGVRGGNSVLSEGLACAGEGVCRSCGMERSWTGDRAERCESEAERVYRRDKG